jgi:hypothetical protein
MNRCQIDARVVRKVAVVVADQRKLAGHLDSRAGEHVQQSERASVVACQHRGRQRRFGEHCAGRGRPGLLVVCAGNHFGVGREAVVAHRSAVGAATVGRSGIGAAVDMVDVAVTELDEVAHRLPNPLGIVGAHRRQVVGRFSEAPPDDHHGNPVRQRLQVCDTGRRAKQDQASAAVAQQRIDRHRLVAIRKVRRQQHLVADAFSGGIDPGNQLGLEELTNVHQYPERAAASPRQ